MCKLLFIIYLGGGQYWIKFMKLMICEFEEGGNVSMNLQFCIFKINTWHFTHYIIHSFSEMKNVKKRMAKIFFFKHNSNDLLFKNIFFNLFSAFLTWKQWRQNLHFTLTFITPIRCYSTIPSHSFIHFFLLSRNSFKHIINIIIIMRHVRELTSKIHYFFMYNSPSEWWGF